MSQHSPSADGTSAQKLHTGPSLVFLQSWPLHQAELCQGLLQVISSYGEKKMFYVAKFHPEQQNVMLAGCGDKKIYQWDMDSGDLVQVRTARFMEVSAIVVQPWCIRMH